MSGVVKFLGILDAVAALVFLMAQFFTPPQKVLYYTAIYLIGKGVLFAVMFHDIASVIDVGCGFYSLIISLGLSNSIVTTLAFLYLTQKAVFSFIKLG